MFSKCVWRGVLLGWLVCGSVSAAPHLLADLAAGRSAESAFAYPISVPGIAYGYVVATDPTYGTELWRSDGTAAGTYRLTDICPGRCDSSPLVFGEVGGLALFLADDGASGRELWATDGTRGGERRVADLCPGPCGWNEPGSNAFSLRGLGRVAERYLFTLSTPAATTLWATDGTPDGTGPVVGLCSGDCVWETAKIANRVLLVLSNQESNRLSLWSTDGTSAGTGVVVPELADLPDLLSLIGGESFGLVFTDHELWRSDGTPGGTSRLATYADLLSGPVDFVIIRDSAWWQGMLIFALDNGDLLRTDGTSGGTARLAAFGFDGVIDLQALPGAVLVVREPSGTAPSELWRTQGPVASTERIASVPEGGWFVDMAPVGATAVLRVQRGLSPNPVAALWASDGTSAGTREIGVVAREWTNGSLVSFGPRALLMGGGYYNLNELWSSDGSSYGTYLIHDFAAAPASSGPLAQTALRDRVVFSAQTSPARAPLFSTDGSAQGTRVLRAGASWAQAFKRAGDRSYFETAHRTFYPTEDGSGLWQLAPNGLWSSDGSVGGTRGITTDVAVLGDAGAVNGRLLGALTGRSPEPGGGSELWKSDGTTPGTQLVREIDPFETPTGLHHLCVPESANPGGFVFWRNREFFAADDGVYGRELWTSDGTPNGTRRVADVNATAVDSPPDDCNDAGRRRDAGSDPKDLVALPSGVIFTADDGVHGRELWMSNGSAAGTRLVADLVPGTAGSSPRELVRFGARACFFAATATAGDALWCSDGTAAGTRKISDLEYRGTPSWGRDLIAVRNRLFFAAYNEHTGDELWSSTGASDASLVTDLRPGPRGAGPRFLTAVGDRLVFAADDGASGDEPWQSDGTAAGTRRIADLRPGPDASSPGPFTLAGGFLLTGADDGVHGREPWILPLADLATPPR